MSEKQDIQAVSNDKSDAHPMSAHSDRPDMNMDSPSTTIVTPEDVCYGPLTCYIQINAYLVIRMLASGKRPIEPFWPC